MKKEEYIKSLGKKSEKDLTDNEVLQFFLQSKVESRHSAMIAMNGGYGLKPNKVEAYKAMREAFEKDKTFRCEFIDGEGLIRDKEVVKEPTLKFSAV